MADEKPITNETKPLEITEDTHVSEILAEYGDVAEVMEAFGVNRVGGLALRKTIGRVLTVKGAARLHRVPLQEFLPMVQRAASHPLSSTSADPGPTGSDTATARTDFSHDEFSGTKGRVAAWFLTSPLRRILDWKMGTPEARLLDFLQLSGDEVVLDSGCGSGFHTLLLAEELPNGNVLAVDLSSEMLDRLRKIARKRGLEDRIEVIHGDGLDLDLDDNSVDRALSAAVWHHLDDPQGACKELVRVVRPGGRVVVSDLKIEPSTKAVAGLKGHDRAFGAQDMSRIMADAGLDEVLVELVGQWLVGVGVKPLDNP
jgi:SAM-dependent methyltransferase